MENVFCQILSNFIQKLSNFNIQISTKLAKFIAVNVKFQAKTAKNSTLKKNEKVNLA